MTSAKTLEIIEAIKQDTSDRIVPCMYSWAFKSRANVSAAFRIAKRDGIIEVAYTSVQNTPVYRRVK